MSVYSRFFGSPIVQIIVNVFNSLIYSYTTVEYRLERLQKRVLITKQSMLIPFLRYFLIQRH